MRIPLSNYSQSFGAIFIERKGFYVSIILQNTFEMHKLIHFHWLNNSDEGLSSLVSNLLQSCSSPDRTTFSNPSISVRVDSLYQNCERAAFAVINPGLQLLTLDCSLWLHGDRAKIELTEQYSA
jgi:hypothetical protein